MQATWRASRHPSGFNLPRGLLVVPVNTCCVTSSDSSVPTSSTDAFIELVFRLRRSCACGLRVGLLRRSKVCRHPSATLVPQAAAARPRAARFRGREIQPCGMTSGLILQVACARSYRSRVWYVCVPGHLQVSPRGRPQGPSSLEPNDTVVLWAHAACCAAWQRASHSTASCMRCCTKACGERSMQHTTDDQPCAHVYARAAKDMAPRRTGPCGAQQHGWTAQQSVHRKS